MKDKKNIFIILTIFGVAILVICIVFFFGNTKEENYDEREENCLGKQIDSVEFNIDTKECFQTQISACQKPTFSSVEECNTLNGLNK
ncbi:MAG: hypothetical protein AB7E37_02950 [Candidatus Altimarinota bacterium]